MRARMIVVGLVGAFAVAAAVTFLVRDTNEPASALPVRTATVGAIEVKIEPHHIDADGAVIRVTLDTHSVDLSMPLRGRLVVGGTEWTAGAWVGAGPSGHHRAGEFAFRSAGAARGPVAFTLTGLAEPVSAEWPASE